MDSELQDFADKTIRHALDSKIQYIDVRAEKYEKNSVLIEDNQIEHVKTNTDQGIGIRIAHNGAWRFCSITNPKSFEQIKEAVDRILKNSINYSGSKKEKINLHPNTTNKCKIDFPVTKRPDLEELKNIGIEYSKIISDRAKIIKSITNPRYVISSKYFVNSEGSEITQNFTDVMIDMIATSHDSGITQSVNITEGGRGGMEQITNKNKVQQSAKDISLKASQLVNSKPVKEEEETTVIMNPDFVALLTHEILGHPSEADRVLGKEMAWAGGAWWKEKIGEKIASENLNVFDDPTIKNSLGWYFLMMKELKQKNIFDRKWNFEKHMQDRETAQIFNTLPTGNMRASNYRFMPLIRMACTCIGNGEWKVDEMIKGVKNGYMISNMKIPSIDMKRHNWSISCQYAEKIEDGEIKDLKRDVIITGTAQNFFESIDACGNDFTVRPITNCGKGDPMQSMIMGNGGPTIRGIATVKSVN